MDKRLFICTVITSVCIALRDILGVGVPDIVLVGLLAGIMMCLKLKDLVPFLFFLFPFTCGIPGYVMLAGFVILLIKRNKWTSSQIFPLAIVTFLELIDEGLGGDKAVLIGMISFLSFTAIFFYFLNDKELGTYDVSKCIFMFVLGTCITFAVIYTNFLSQYGLNTALLGIARGGAIGIKDNDTGIMRGHLAMNANTIAYYAVCGISCLVVLFKNYNRLITITMIVFMIFCGCLTISRTFILTLALFIVLYVISVNAKKKLLFAFGTVVGFILLNYCAGEYIDRFWGTMLDRSTSANVSTASGRTDLFEAYNEVWIQNPIYILLGCGAVDYYAKLKIWNAMHSGLQQIWVCLGLPGLILFTQQIWAFCSKYFTIKRFVYIIPFVVTFVFDQSIQFLNPYPLMLPIMVSLFVCKVGKIN